LLTSAELHDPRTGRWKLTGSMATALAPPPTLTTLNVGGDVDSDDRLNSVGLRTTYDIRSHEGDAMLRIALGRCPSGVGLHELVLGRWQQCDVIS
jgi:hypothetical protein